MDDALELIVDAHASLGESPVWDERQRRLWWVDLLGGIVHATDPVTGEDRQIPVGQPIGAIALRESGRPILAVRDGYATLDSIEREARPDRADRAGRPGHPDE